MDFVVECADSCNNAPKKQLLKDLTIAFTKNDIEYCLNFMREDIIWDIVGEKQIQGLADFKDTLQQNRFENVQRLEIDHIITHGNVGSVNGTVCLKNDDNIAFCSVYQFGGFGKNAKIKKITSYVIK